MACKYATVPAPVGGTNAIDALMTGQDSQDCIYALNVISQQYGLAVRAGFIEWETNLANSVLTVISVQGTNVGGVSQDRLFACTKIGIYEITTSGSAPTLVVNFPSTTGLAGYGQYEHFTTSASTFVVYCDEVNGMYTFDVVNNIWTKVTLGAGAAQISGQDPATFCAVKQYQGRLFFVQKSTGTSWYAAPGAIYGAVTKFELGNKFNHGGALATIQLYTQDGGLGPNNYIVFISTSGDVILYQGADPSVAGSFIVGGQWWIGQTPAGRRFATQYGGDLLILSVYGMLPISKLVQGLTLENPQTFMTRKISNFLNADMALLQNTIGWEVNFIPNQNLLIITVPFATGSSWKQYVQSLQTQGWSTFRDVPMNTTAIWQGFLHFGTQDNRVCRHFGSRDNVPLAGGGIQISWSFLTWYSNLGTPMQKIPGLVRPYFLAQAQPSFDIKCVFDFDLTEVTGAITAIGAAGALWDVGVWDAAIWGGTTLTPYVNTEGLYGIGVNLALAVRGSSTVDTRFIGAEIEYEELAFV